MAKKRKKRKKKSGSDGTSSASTGVPKTASGGGVMQSMRNGFKSAVGAGDSQPKQKESTLSNVLWTIVLIAAVAFLLYRWL
ncbi:MAG: hypothetical protein VYE22_36645 [Myxococcota bacterium]|nr:hypothetical protein [Myxococcota bacterium]